MNRIVNFLARLMGRLGTVDQAVASLASAVTTLETVRDKVRAQAYDKAAQAVKLTTEATDHHEEADRAHRVATAISSLIA